MARFLAVDDLYINLNYVAVIEQKLDDDERYTEFRSADGSVMHRSSGWMDNRLQHLCSVILPARLGDTAVVITPSAIADESDGRPTEVGAVNYPIVGWDTDGEFISPVVPCRPPGSTVFILLEDGSLTNDDCHFSSIESAKEAVLEQAQYEWDSDHSDEA